MRPVPLVPTINSRRWNATYVYLQLSVHRSASTPQGSSGRALLLGGGSAMWRFNRCAGGVPSSVRPLQPRGAPPVHSKQKPGTY